MDELRQQLIADKGGPECISTAERVMIDLTVEAAVRHQRVSAYLAEMPSLVDKKHRKVFPSCATARTSARSCSRC